MQPRTHRHARGFSLVELMVAMTLSLILLGGVIAIFTSSRTTYETNDRMARIQESGRFALDSIVRDLRASGYIGCAVNATFRNKLNNSTSLLWNFGRTLEGFDGQGTAYAPNTLDTDLLKAGANIDLTPSTDVLVVRTPRPGAPLARVISGIPNGTEDVVVDPAVQNAFKANDVVMISDCNERAVFEVTAVNGNSLAHAKSNPTTGGTPGNSEADLGYAYAKVDQDVGAEVIPVQTIIYFLAKRKDAPGTAPPSLWRRVAAGPIEEIVEGVENIQLAYGEITGANTVTYRKAGDVTNWGNVVTVNIALLVRSQSEYGNDRDVGTYDLISSTLGARVTAFNDRHLRQVFATTVSLRNTTL